MDETAVRLGVSELIAAYVDCIDEDRLEDWPDFFVEQCRYVVTSRASHEAGLQHGVIYAASRGMLIDRITALRQVLHPFTPIDAMEFVLKHMRPTRSNAEFLGSMNR